MGEWKEYKLGDLTTKIGSGATPTGGDNSYKLEGISLIRSQNILDFQFSYNGLAFIDDQQADALRNVTVASGDVLLNITGDSVARVCKVPEKVLPARVNQHVAIIRADKEKLDSDYLLYDLQAKKDYLLSISEIGATRRALTKGMLKDFDLTIPDLPEQKSIASVLSSLDDKIDLLHRQNKTLEALAETLFRQWFVEEAEEGWETGKLGDFGKIICGKTPSKKIHSYFGGDIPFIKIPDMHGKTFIFDTVDSLTEEGANSQQNKFLPAKSICVSCIATVGLVTMNALNSQTNQQINSIVPRKEIYRYFIYLKLATMKDELLSMASGGTATDNLNTGDFSNIEIIKPEDKVLELFHSQVQPNFDKIFANQIQTRTLTRLRDTLLPKLMSGEVRVKNTGERHNSIGGKGS
ncbi:MAG: restriction endonuclease subunit S [Thermodesulfovibrionales bacterium]|nr:restriction endonuclease subunit S [Thermodesulfovibrionales bacterium]